MSSEIRDGLLDDYLDDRLSPAERADFERRLAADPILARRVRAEQERIRALRGSDEELSAGFHARARARFEETTPAARSTAWGRFVSWEAAGLATAAMLVAVVLIPAMWRGEVEAPADLPRRQAPAVSESKPAAAQADAPSEAAAAESDLVELDDVSGKTTLETQQDETPQQRQDERVVRAPPPAPAPGSREKKKIAKEAIVADSLDLAEEETTGRSAPPTRRVPAPDSEDRDRAHAAPAPSATPEIVRREEAGERESRARELAQSSVRSAELSSVKAGAAGPDAEGFTAVVRHLRGAAMPAGSVRPGHVGEITDPLLWPEELRPPTSAELAKRSFADSPDRGRAIVVGPRTVPFDCAATVVEDPLRYVIRLQAANDDPGAHRGCAFLLPDDGKEVVVLDPE